ncbi:MAG: Jag N-terminal domain-containing protein [Sulfuricurvum sp.]|uniref:Jag N-terminal domain-containing protein n=1 Tax=Sulfuricurvum sp. TaxID=2025608 RepID=UPI0026222004|nr:Jag N-terminal domain-containing protein [Sulfuricurvum sp.]MDD2828525.1 Jag N-terminal domain-containing protein [Sulfuricurvum sp.]MDD4948944.1 Jag N-terminal domain-containing protein [Sulfuricurvum sp.]
MKKIEAETLELAYAQAASAFGCSVTQLQVEIIQFPSKGVLGLFKKSAIIIANLPQTSSLKHPQETHNEIEEEELHEEICDDVVVDEADSSLDHRNEELFAVHDDEEEELEHYDDYAMEMAYDEMPIEECAIDVKAKINALFKSTCFELNEIEVSVYDENTLLVEFSGADSALMIGKEGYRYKALSYMLFNWINAMYGLQLRLEIAEFLKNQEESISRYLVGVYENVDRDGRAQTKILDGVLVQIALTQLRNRYPDRYVAIRSTRDGGKFIIINSYHEY